MRLTHGVSASFYFSVSPPVEQITADYHQNPGKANQRNQKNVKTA